MYGKHEVNYEIELSVEEDEESTGKGAESYLCPFSSESSVLKAPGSLAGSDHRTDGGR
jgi:hypothetical protein